MKFLNCSVLVLIIWSSPILAFGYYDTFAKGTVLGGFSPYTVACGTVRAVGAAEPACIFTNPAQISTHPFMVQLSGSSISWAERVIINDVNKTLRTLLTYDNGLAAVVYPVGGGITVGAGLAKIAEYGYDGMAFISGSSYEDTIGVTLLKSSGEQIEAMGSFSAVVSDPLSVGFSIGMRRISTEFDYQYDSFEVQIPDSSLVSSRISSELAWHAGLALNGELFKSGLSYSSETEDMEDIIAFGGSAYAEHLKKITMGFEAEITSPFDKNQFLGKLFLSMPLTKSLEALVSVSFDDNRIANRAGFGFGMGFSGHVGRFTIGGGILNRFRARRNTNFPGEYANRVDDSYTIINLGVSYLLGN